MDKGAQILSPNYSTIMALIKEVGLEDEVIEMTHYNSLVRDGEPYRINSLNFKSVITSGLLRLWELKPQALAALAPDCDCKCG